MEIKEQIEKARKQFEEYITLKGLSFEWTGTRYKSINTQTKWIYYRLGFFANKE
jgi:hypothetical protein